MSKVFLALLDGMRPDSLTTCNHPFFRELLSTSRYSMNMRTVMPSVTLPCHMSLFHGVTHLYRVIGEVHVYGEESETVVDNNELSGIIGNADVEDLTAVYRDDVRTRGNVIVNAEVLIRLTGAGDGAAVTEAEGVLGNGIGNAKSELALPERYA